MSMLVRRSLRAIPRARGFATTAGDVTKTSYQEKQAALRAHAAETADMWRKISFYVCLPAIITAAFWVRNVEKEHEEHLEHAIHENKGKAPLPPAYEYLNRRAIEYPWGPNSLFFNPRVQKDLSNPDA
ncbi:unnamed protein product [Somion occarium]|uniref:Mitochondrial cytochrome c oxidase subunit VIa n=1 Tax=Somion occarium TaxID=3059160 RepID=A0ABP1CKZ1_9APHY